MTTLRKYTSAFSVSLQGTMAYRADFLLGLAGGCFAVIIQFFLWTAIYGGNTEREFYGYTYNRMIAYVIMAGILSKVMATGFEWEISSDIKNGGLSRFLVQPVSYLAFRLMSFFGKKTVHLVAAIVLTFTVLGLLNITVNFELSVQLLGLSLAAVMLSLVMNSLLFYCFSTLAFWITEVWVVFIGLGVASNILSGGVFPLDVFGDTAQAVFGFLPFQYVIYFPLNMICGRLETPAILMGLAIQIVWIAVLYVTAKILWSVGMKKYIAAGG